MVYWGCITLTLYWGCLGCLQRRRQLASSQIVWQTSRSTGLFGTSPKTSLHVLLYWRRTIFVSNPGGILTLKFRTFIIYTALGPVKLCNGVSNIHRKSSHPTSYEVPVDFHVHLFTFEYLRARHAFPFTNLLDAVIDFSCVSAIRKCSLSKVGVEVSADPTRTGIQGCGDNDIEGHHS